MMQKRGRKGRKLSNFVFNPFSLFVCLSFPTAWIFLLAISSPHHPQMALLQPGLLLSFTAPEMYALLATPFLAESESHSGYGDTLFPTMGIPAHPQLSTLAKTWPRPAPQEPAARGSQPGDILPGDIHPGSATSTWLSANSPRPHPQFFSLCCPSFGRGQPWHCFFYALPLVLPSMLASSPPRIHPIQQVMGWCQYQALLTRHRDPVASITQRASSARRETPSKQRAPSGQQHGYPNKVDGVRPRASCPWRHPHVHLKACARKLPPVLFTVAKTWKQLKIHQEEHEGTSSSSFQAEQSEKIKLQSTHTYVMPPP